MQNNCKKKHEQFPNNRRLSSYKFPKLEGCFFPLTKKILPPPFIPMDGSVIRDAIQDLFFNQKCVLELNLRS